MSKREAPVRFHDWCGARDRKAATRRRWRSRCIRLVAVPVSDWAGRPGAGGRLVILLHPRLTVAQKPSAVARGPVGLRAVTLNEQADIHCRPQPRYCNRLRQRQHSTEPAEASRANDARTTITFD
jgi:hypothetical protein